MKRAERPAQISPMSRDRAAASAAPPPKNAATAGAAATAIPPRPMHSSTAESPMSQRGVLGREALAQQRVLDGRGGRREPAPRQAGDLQRPSRSRCAT